jgi:zinc/manganese transport system ATP-binding protein
MIVLKNIDFFYNNQKIFQNYDLKIDHNSVTKVVGFNGSGKSTLLKILAKILKPHSGQVKFLKDYKVGYFPQTNEIDRRFPISVFELVKMGCHACKVDNHKKIQEALEIFGIGDIQKKYIGFLSGGQLQRALLAQFFLLDADLLLLDEPFNGIDTNTVKDIFNIFKMWKKLGKTVVISLHEWSQSEMMFDQQVSIA